LHPTLDIGSVNRGEEGDHELGVGGGWGDLKKYTLIFVPFDIGVPDA